MHNVTYASLQILLHYFYTQLGRTHTMFYPIESSTLRILNTKGHIMGTGFLISKSMTITCVHIAPSASMVGENSIRV